MRIEKRNEKGITLVALSITIIVLLIIAGITIYYSKDTIKRANLESIKTNMMLIEAKARECVEEANFKLGPNKQKIDEIATIRDEVYEDGTESAAQLKKIDELKSEKPQVSIPDAIPQDETVYWVTSETLEKWGLNKIELEDGEVYLIKFDEENVKVEIYNNLGFDSKYSLTEINEIEI